MTISSNLAENPNRRLVLKELAAAGIVAGLGGIVDQESEVVAQERPREVLEGYAGRQSYEPGDTLGLHVSTTAREFSMEIARIGATRDVVWTKNRIPGARHPTPENAFSH